MRRLSARTALAATLLGAALSGCAGTVPVELPAVPPSPAAPAATPVPGRTAATAPLAGAPGDTVPSSAARAVLASIPEPLPGGTPTVDVPHGPEAPPPPSPLASPPAAAPAPVRRDSNTSAPAPAAPDTESVPVPSPTIPLGSGMPVAVPETPPPPVTTRPAAAVRPAEAPAASATRAAADTCWRVQVGAPAEGTRGSSLREASQSQLLVPMVVEHEAGRWKVRTRECLSRRAAESLRDRAFASGFNGVFLVRYVGKR